MGSAALRPPSSVGEQLRIDRRRRSAVYAQICALSVIAGALALGTAPHPISLAVLLLICLAGAVFVNPAIGVFAVVFLSMIGSPPVWFPFSKNLSSSESILFVSEGLSINPLEIILFATIAAWLLRGIGAPTFAVHRGRLLRPMVAFTVFTIAGLAYGLSQGADPTVALWEMRPLLYIPILYLLVTNLITTARQYEWLFLTAIGGIVVQSLFTLNYYRGLTPEQQSDVDSLAEHAVAIQLNVILLLVLALLTLTKLTPLRRLVLILAAVPVGWTWVLSQRRAAAIALCVGLVLLGVLLSIKNKRAAMWFIPVTLVGGVAYTLAFWNSTGDAGFAAQAIKSVIAPGSLSAKDRSSDLYRQIEAFDIWTSVRSNELLGLGFGKPFLRPIELPDITDFLLAPYKPHNSILWIWLKMGVLGFVSMLLLFVRTVQYGARSLVRASSPELTFVIFGSLAYVLMYLVYAYVDIAWEPRSTVLLAVTCAICADLDPLATPAEPDESVTPTPVLEVATS